MINLVFCIKSKESFRRIQNTLKIDNNLEIEEFIPNLDMLQSNITVKHYDIALVDEKLSWKEEALDVLNKKGTQIVIFKGNFKKSISEIYDKISAGQKEDGTLEDSDKSQESFIPYPVINYHKTPPIKAWEEAPSIGQQLFNGIENKLIITASLSHGGGSTFLSVNLAKALTDLKIRASVIELPINEPYLFYYLGIDKKLNMKCTEKIFYSYPHLINAGLKPPKNKETIIDNIVWLIANPLEGKIDNWDSLKTRMLIESSRRSPINIIDAGVNYDHESMQALLTDADFILVTVNPVFCELSRNREKIENLIKLKKEGSPVEFIINRYTSAITKKDLSAYFKNTALVYIPAIETKYIQEASNKFIMPLTHPQIVEKLFSPLSEIIKNIIPMDVLKETMKDKPLNERNVIYRLKEKAAGFKSIFSGLKS